MDLRVGENTLGIYLGGERLSTHPSFPSCAKNRYSTHEADLPKDSAYCDWDSARIHKWAERIGSSCSAVIEHIFQSVRFDKQGFNAALAILRLSHKYGASRLEVACSLMLSTGKCSPRYRDIKSIIETRQDKLAMSGSEYRHEDTIGYVRGASFYEEVQ